MKKKLLLGFCLLLASISYAQFTTILDDNFEQALITQGYDDVLDDKVLTANISSLTFLNLTGDDNLNFNENEIGLGIQSLIGIKGFSSLETLWIQGNELEDVDLQGMSTLIDVRAFYNQLGSINIIGLTKLEIIGLNGNSITGINVSSNLSLQQFDINGNNLISLDVSGLNALTGLDVQNNSQLSCIKVTNATAAANYNNDTANFKKNGTTVFSDICSSNYTSILDDNFEQHLIDTGIDTEGILDDKVLTSDLTGVTILELANLNIASLVGINAFTSLQRLVATNNQLSSIDLTQNTALIHLGLQNNSLSNINVTQNVNLTYLDVARNTGLTSIDLSKNIALEKFYGFLSSFQNLDVSQNTLLTDLGMSDNQLSTIDISNNNLLQVIFLDNNNLSSLNISNLPVSQVQKLYTCNNTIECIQVSDVNAANAKTSGTCPERPTQPDGWHKDPSSSYNLDCTSQPFLVTTTISNAGNAPNYVIEEGKSFELNFDTSGTGTNGYIYKPIITLTKNGVETNEDFSITNLNQNFTISTNNPDGSISFTANDDNEVEGDETYEINIFSEDTDLYTIANPISFEVVVKDKQVNAPVLLTASIMGVEFLGADYAIGEGQTIDIQIESSSGVNGETFSIPIDLSRSTANQSFINSPSNSFPITINSNANPDGIISFDILNSNAVNDDKILEIILNKPEGNYQWSEPFFGEDFMKFTVYINRYAGETVYFSTVVSGAEELEVNPSELIEKSFKTKEGDIVEITLNALDHNATGFLFDVLWFANGQNIESSDLKITNQNGDLINDDENLSIKVNSSEEFDYKLIIEFLDDQDIEGNEEFYLSFNPDFEMPLAAFQGASSAEAPYTIKFLVEDNDVGESIFLAFNNTGGMENSGIADTLQVTLKNPNGTNFLNNTTSDIIIPVTFDTLNLIRPAYLNDFIPSGNEFRIKPNDSIAIITVLYPLEVEEGFSPEPNYYNIKFGTPSIPITIEPNEHQLKILEEGKFDVFTSFTGEAKRQDVGGADCCFSWKVEEGAILTFSFEAEKGVPIGTDYLLNIDRNRLASWTNATFTSYEEGDYELSTTETTNIARRVRSGTDNFLLLEIVEDSEEEEPESFALNFSSSSGVKYSYSQLGASDKKYNFEIVDAIPANLNATIPSVNEEDAPTEFAEIEVTLSKTLDERSEVSFNIGGTATYGVDYILESQNTLQINNNIATIFWIEDDLSTFIKIIPINEEANQAVPEFDETVILEIIDDFGYVPGNNPIATVTITDTDEAEYEASITINPQEETIYEDESREPNSASIVVSLDKENTRDTPIRVNFQFNSNALDVAIPNEDFKVITMDGQTEIDITENEDKFVIIPKNAISATVIIRAIDDSKEEIAEKVIIELLDGFNYKPNASVDTPQITIISKDQNTSFVDFSLVTVKINSATCPGLNEGDIIMSNATPFDFTVQLNDLDGNILEESSIVKNTFNEETVFENLASGSYEIRLFFNSDANTEIPEDVIAPIYNIDIRELGATKLIAKTINFSSKVASLELVGSSYYKVENGDENYEFFFSSRGENKVSIPLKHGVNNLRIKSEAECQGVIEESIYLNNYVIYPNPTQDIFNVAGFNEVDLVEIKISDSSGKIVLNTKKVVANQQISVDIDNLSKGIYFADIITIFNEKISIKIVKK